MSGSLITGDIKMIQNKKTTVTLLFAILLLAGCKPYELTGTICSPERFNGADGKTIGFVGTITDGTPAGVVDLKEDNKGDDDGGFIYHCRKAGTATFSVKALAGGRSKTLRFKISCS